MGIAELLKLSLDALALINALAPQVALSVELVQKMQSEGRTELTDLEREEMKKLRADARAYLADIVEADA